MRGQSPWQEEHTSHWGDVLGQGPNEADEGRECSRLNNQGKALGGGGT